MAMRIGVDHLVFAPITSDSADQIVFGEVKKLPGVQKITINPNSSTETAFYDDGPGESASTLGEIEVSIDKAYLTTSEKNALLGHTIDAKGVLLYGASDSAPEVAIGFRTLKSNGKYRYVWLLKGVFSEPEDANETKGESISFQSDSLVGAFAKTNAMFSVDGAMKQLWKTELDEDHATADSEVAKAWFTKPYVPGAAGASFTKADTPEAVKI